MSEQVFDQDILDALAEVRESGIANMMSRREVQYAANKLNLYGLVVFIQDTLEDRANGAATYLSYLTEMGERRTQ